MKNTVKVSKAFVIENLHRALGEYQTKITTLLAENGRLKDLITELAPTAEAELLSKSPEKWLEQFKTVSPSSFCNRIRPSKYTTYIHMGKRYREGQSYDYVLKDTKEYFDNFLGNIFFTKASYSISDHLKEFFAKADLKTCYTITGYYNTFRGNLSKIRTLQCEVTKLTTSINLLENSIDDYIEHVVSIPRQYTCED
jgi:hypothetical protein